MRIDYDQQNSSSLLTVEQLKNIYEAVFNSEKGRIILDDLSLKCSLMSSNLYDNVNHMYYVEGQKSLFLYILAWLERKNNSNNVSEDDNEDLIN